MMTYETLGNLMKPLNGHHCHHLQNSHAETRLCSLAACPGDIFEDPHLSDSAHKTYPGRQQMGKQWHARCRCPTLACFSLSIGRLKGLDISKNSSSVVPYTSCLNSTWFSNMSEAMDGHGFMPSVYQHPPSWHIRAHLASGLCSPSEMKTVFWFHLQTCRSKPSTSLSSPSKLYFHSSKKLDSWKGWQKPGSSLDQLNRSPCLYS